MRGSLKQTMKKQFIIAFFLLAAIACHTSKKIQQPQQSVTFDTTGAYLVTPLSLDSVLNTATSIRIRDWATECDSSSIYSSRSLYVEQPEEKPEKRVIFLWWPGDSTKIVNVDTTNLHITWPGEAAILMCWRLQLRIDSMQSQLDRLRKAAPVRKIPKTLAPKPRPSPAKSWR